MMNSIFWMRSDTEESSYHKGNMDYSLKSRQALKFTVLPLKFFRDATWEQEKDAYADLVKSKCVSENCKYPEKWAKRGEFQIVTCIVCGCLPMHVRCTKTTAEKYHCTECINKTFLNLFHS